MTKTDFRSQQRYIQCMHNAYVANLGPYKIIKTITQKYKQQKKNVEY